MKAAKAAFYVHNKPYFIHLTPISDQQVALKHKLRLGSRKGGQQGHTRPANLD